MKRYSVLLVSGGLALAAVGNAEPVTAASEIVDTVLVERSLEVAADTDVIVDRVSVPPNTVLSRRSHPGEMFVYVTQGSVILARDGEPETLGSRGDLLEVGLRKIYSARTTDEGAELVIFRVHEAGQPVRVIQE